MKKPLPPQPRLMVISHTHWDREWYRTFQSFRLSLTHLVDDLIRILDADPGYRFFMLDGQTVVLEDYLEIRPDRKADLKRHISSGRILVGPWYVLPDEFLVGAEAIVRNLLIGHRVARDFGEPMSLGYLPDSFGHSGQMPQILRGFGIDTAVVWRGIGPELESCEFTWRSPDGSEVLALYLPGGYFNAITIPEEDGRLSEFISEVRGQLEPMSRSGVLVLMNGFDHLSPRPHVPAAIARADTTLQDAQLVHSNLPEALKAIKEWRFAAGDLPVVEGDLRSPVRAHLLPGVLSTRSWIKQRNCAGERALSQWAEPLSAAATLLVSGQRADDWKAAVRLGWKYLLQNQAHDSICGCSIDQVHEEMRTRYDWSRQLAEGVAQEALELIAGQIDIPPLESSHFQSGRPVVCVFNPTEGPRTDAVEVRARVPLGEPLWAVGDSGRRSPCQVVALGDAETFSTEVLRAEMQRQLARFAGTQLDEARLDELGGLLLSMAHETDPAVGVTDVYVGTVRRTDIVSVDMRAAAGVQHNRPALVRALGVILDALKNGEVAMFQVRTRRTDLGEAELAFVASDVPGLGYATYRIEAGAPGHDTPRVGTFVENEFYRVTANQSDGTLEVMDRLTGVVTRGLGRFVDDGEAGDEYNRDAPPVDRVVRAPASRPRITVQEQGPARTTLQVSMTMPIPASLSADRLSRSSVVVDNEIVMEATVYPGVRRVDIRTRVANRSLDHRLRAYFPTGAGTDARVTALSHYGVDVRPLQAPEPARGGYEDPVSTRPHQGFVHAGDGSSGLMVAAPGLPEYETLVEHGQAVIAITLLRCVAWLSRDDLASRRGYAGPATRTPGAQQIGDHEFFYSIMPGTPVWEEALQDARRFMSPMRAIVIEPHKGALPGRLGLVDVWPRSFVVAAVKLPEDGAGLLVRVVNVGTSPATGSIRLWKRFKSARLTSLAEEPLRELAADSDVVELTLKRSEVATVLFTFPDE